MTKLIRNKYKKKVPQMVSVLLSYKRNEWGGLTTYYFCVSLNNLFLVKRSQWSSKPDIGVVNTKLTCSTLN